MLKRVIDNKDLIIEVHDEPGPGGANHHYSITGFNTESNPSAIYTCGYTAHYSRLPILFQNGPILESGKNGITVESLLTICKDRLDSFQSGNFACEENQEALDAIEKALRALERRTLARQIRGVEGKSIV